MERKNTPTFEQGMDKFNDDPIRTLEMVAATRESLGEELVDTSTIENRLDTLKPKLAELLAELFILEEKRGEPDLKRLTQVSAEVADLFRKNPELRLLGRLYQLRFD